MKFRQRKPWLTLETLALPHELGWREYFFMSLLYLLKQVIRIH